MMQQTFEQLRTIICGILSVDADQVTMETNLIEDLQADSLDVVGIIMQVENTFGVEVEDEDADKFKTIGDVVAYLEK